MARPIFVPDDWPRKTIERRELQITDLLDPDAVRGAVALHSVASQTFAESIGHLPVEWLLVRPRSDAWSLLEHCRHLLFANQLHFEQFVLGERDHFSPLGLPPAHLSGKAEFATAGIAIEPDISDVFASRRIVQDRFRSFAETVTAEKLAENTKSHGGKGSVGACMQGFIWHDYGHFCYCDEIVRTFRRERR